MANFGLRFIHVCETAIVDKTEKLSIINIFHNLSVTQFPAVHQITVVGGVFYKGDEDKRPESFKLEIKVIDPGKIEIISIPQELPLSSGGDSGFVTVIAPLQMAIAGEHIIDVLVEGKSIGKTTLNVMLATQQR